MSTGVLKEEINCSYRNSFTTLKRVLMDFSMPRFSKAKRNFVSLSVETIFFRYHLPAANIFFMSANNLFGLFCFSKQFFFSGFPYPLQKIMVRPLE